MTTMDRVIPADGLALPQGCMGLAARCCKRACDLLFTLPALALAVLPMCLIALAIKLCDRGPVFYVQRRLTRGGRIFPLLKFRTMITDAEATGPAFAQNDDPRCTTIGRWLRAASLDELPQLLNVLAGHMSLVGPRPERPEMLEKIRQDLPAFPLRLQVKAGLTGLAQIYGYRGPTCFRKRLLHDLYYVNHWSPILDLKILLATPAALLKHSK